MVCRFGFSIFISVILFSTFYCGVLVFCERLNQKSDDPWDATKDDLK